MKNINFYKADKYLANSYIKVSEYIYKIKGDEQELFVTSLSFEQEPEYDEGSSPNNISQYPLEDVLDEFLVYIGDFYDEINAKSENTCYLEYCSDDIEDIQKLLSIIGKHVYNKQEERDGKTYVNLVIED